MRITVLSMNFWPEETGTGPVVQNLVEDLAGLGHEVRVVAGFPYYPRRVIPASYRGRWLVEEKYGDIPVYRAWIWGSDEKSALKKTLLHLSFTFSCLPALLRAGRPDVLISITPPLFVPTVAGLLSRIWRCAHVIRLEDMLPDAPIIYGLVRSPSLIAALRGIERLNYRLSDAVVAICAGFSRSLESKGQDMTKVAVIPHYVIPPLQQDQVNGFRQENGIPEGVLLAQYAGNLGHSQGLEVILHAAEILRDDRRVHFTIVGEGVARDGLVRDAEKSGLQNITLLPVQPVEKLDELLWAADVCLVTQKANVLDINVPSKIFTIMAHARPMIAAVNPRSDAAAIVRASGAGPVIPPGSAEDLAREIVAMLDLPDRGRSLGFAGKEFAEKEYSRARSVAAYEDLLSKVVVSRD